MTLLPRCLVPLLLVPCAIFPEVIDVAPIAVNNVWVYRYFGYSSSTDFDGNSSGTRYNYIRTIKIISTEQKGDTLFFVASVRDSGPDTLTSGGLGIPAMVTYRETDTLFTSSNPKTDSGVISIGELYRFFPFAKLNTDSLPNGLTDTASIVQGKKAVRYYYYYHSSGIGLITRTRTQYLIQDIGLVSAYARESMSSSGSYNFPYTISLISFNGKTLEELSANVYDTRLLSSAGLPTAHAFVRTLVIQQPNLPGSRNGSFFNVQGQYINRAAGLMPKGVYIRSLK